MNVTVLTNSGSIYGKKVIRALRRADVPASVVVVRQPPAYTLRLFRSVARRVGLFDALLLAVKRLLDGRRERDRIGSNDPELMAGYEDICRRVVYTIGTNRGETKRAIKDFGTDLLVLGQAGIARRAILQIPKIGTLNAHPGILPFYRGIDCPQWALFNGDLDKIGASVHWVDEGIDTGGIISTRGFPVRGMPDMSVIESRLYDLCAEMIAEVVAAIGEGRTPEGTPQSPEGGKQYYKMSFRTERTLKPILQSL